MRPFPPDAGLAPCQVPPLLADDAGGFFLETAPGVYGRVAASEWGDLREESHHLVVAASRVRISSPRCIEVLQRAKRRGATPHEAVRQAWRMALSPARSGREWRRWKLVSSQLWLNGPVLAVGFFVGLPLVYVFMGTLQTLILAGWLWCVMAWTAAQLWWLGKRVYPGARSALRMDALLSLLVPFHAMRALEIASVHAMGTTHPVGLILSAAGFWESMVGSLCPRHVVSDAGSGGGRGLPSRAAAIAGPGTRACRENGGGFRSSARPGRRFGGDPVLSPLPCALPGGGEIVLGLSRGTGEGFLPCLIARWVTFRWLLLARVPAFPARPPAWRCPPG